MILIVWQPERAREIIPEVITLLEKKKVMAYPTETVYGLGGLVDPAVYENIARIKQRPSGKGFILLMPSIRFVFDWTDSKSHSRILQLARAFWPGPLTVVAHAQAHVPSFVRASDGSIAFRISSHSFCQALLRMLQKPIISTSVNITGEQPARSIHACRAIFPNLGLYIDGGVLPGGTPSTIISLTEDQPILLRKGPISKNDIESVLHTEVLEHSL